MGYYSAGLGLTDYVCADSYFRHLSVYADCLAALTWCDERIVLLAASPAPGPFLVPAGLERLRKGQALGRPAVEAHVPTAAEEAALGVGGREAGELRVFTCSHEGGRRDVIYARVGPGGGLDEICKALRVIWPLLRRAALAERPATTGLGVAAMLWAMASQGDLATIVARSDGTIVEVNAAGREMLDAEVLLRSRGNRMEAVSPALRAELRQALTRCGGADPAAEPEMLIVGGCASSEPGAPACAPAFAGTPITLRRFFRDGRATDLVVITVPTPPSPQRICDLALRRGLTRTEARIAELLYRGLPNRDIATTTGLTEETVKTYAKRVLAKLNVTRPALAHVMTWQASGGRMT